MAFRGNDLRYSQNIMYNFALTLSANEANGKKKQQKQCLYMNSTTEESRN
jgi:hypothetical protein